MPLSFTRLVESPTPILPSGYTQVEYVERNLIPCKRDNDDVAGFYDTVYGVFYTALSGTPLTAGPIV